MTSPLSPMKLLLAERIRSRRRALWDWYLDRARQAPAPFYCSVDLRDAAYKIAPVDSNLYPAGFNNICPDDLRAAPPIVRAQIEGLASRWKRSAPGRILVIPESHTSNLYYLENLYYLTRLLSDAGFEVAIGWYGPVPEGAAVPLKLKTATDKELVAYPIEILGGTLSAGDFVPDWILLNNDFSAGYPTALDNVVQPILPSHVLGWHTRRKSEHFVHYNALASGFAHVLDVDPWMIQVMTETVGPVNFNEEQGIEQVAQAVERVISATREAYRRNSISHEPFAFVKNNSGTYGIGIMVVRSAEELLKMNRRTKNKMSVGKGKTAISSVVVQEGIPTATLVDRLAAEPVIYLCGTELIGGFLRTNTERGTEDNLNSQGMVFKKLCVSDLRGPEGDQDLDESDENPVEEPVLELVYGSIARLAALATGLELEAHLRELKNRSPSAPQASLASP